MARTYKRKSNGQFAGGGGSRVSSNGGGSKPKAAAGKKKTNSVVKANQMANAAKKKRANPSGQLQMKSKGKSTKGQKALKFIARNPRLVIGVAAIAAANVPVGSSGTGSVSKATAAMAKAAKYAADKASDKRGIGGKPGANLRASKKNLRGAYKIRSS